MATLCTKIDASFSNDVTVTPHILHVSSDAKKKHPLKGNLESRARGWRQTSFPVLSPVLKLPTPTQYFPRRLLFFIARPPVSPWGHSSPVFFPDLRQLFTHFPPFFVISTCFWLGCNCCASSSSVSERRTEKRRRERTFEQISDAPERRIYASHVNFLKKKKGL